MKHLLTLLSLCLLSLSVSAQSFEWKKKGEEAAPAAPATAEYNAAYNSVQQGFAEAYSKLFSGKVTAYGERYDPTALTAHHRLLPLGTLVRVTNLSNSQTVTVRINGKAQACEECLITLSTAAADAIGLEVRSQVSVERTGFSNWNPQAPSPSTYGTAIAVEPAPASPSTRGRTAQVLPAPAGSTSPAAAPSVLDREVTPTPEPAVNEADYVVAGSATPATYTSAPVAATRSYPEQAAPPAPTVPKYQEGRQAPAPVNYPMPTSAQVAKGTVAAPAGVPAPPTQALTNESATGAAVQLGAYSNLDYARKQVEDLQRKGLTTAFYRTAAKPDGSMIHRVYGGTFADRADAQVQAAHIRDVYQVAGVVVDMK